MQVALSGSPGLTSVKTLSQNGELKQAQCSAKYTFIYNGKPREIDVPYDLAYLQDKGETEVKVAVGDVMGGIMAIVMREQPIKNGVEKVIDPKTGNLQHEIEWKHGVQDGVEKIYKPATNKLIAQINVVNGKKSGAEKWWNADGSQLLIDLIWVDGKATGFQKQYDASGNKLITDLVWKDGKATGLQTTGNLETNYDEYHFKDGLYDGIHKHYGISIAANGVFLFKTDNYKDGKLDGLSQELDEAGKVVAESNFKNGVAGPASVQSASTTPSGGKVSSEKCLDSKITKFHKEKGNDALVSNDMITEWETSCNGR
jgi:antitoxin component YwqK of YwqJK toxin-antitoxin module